MLKIRVIESVVEGVIDRVVNDVIKRANPLNRLMSSMQNISVGRGFNLLSSCIDQVST